MKVHIIGHLGNMGRRYRSILEHLGHEWSGEDLDNKVGDHKTADAYIIATSTHHHVDAIRAIKGDGKPILCEKPICKDQSELRDLMAACVLAGTRLQMVAQYDYLVRQEDVGDSHYNYFKSGPDGLAWDCIQIIWHAKSRPAISNLSPVWDCKINGRRLSLGEMDGAYVAMIRDWIKAPRNDIFRILDSHQKVNEWLAKS